MKHRDLKQQCLPFDTDKEIARRERVERLLGITTKLTTAARMFDEAAYVEASAIARGEQA